MIQLLNLNTCPHLYAQLIAIWQESFGDSKAYIQKFFASNAKHTKVVICQKADRVVSVAYLLPVSYVQKDGAMLDCYYLYAAATLPVCRGRGYFGRILQFVNAHIKESVILVPASTNLLDYYKKHGFKVWLTEKKDALDQLENKVMKLISKEAYCRFRQEVLLKPHSMLWNDEMMDYICKEHQEAGGHFVETVIDGERVAFMCLGEGKEWHMTEMFSHKEGLCMHPTVMVNKPFEEAEKGYFNLTMG